MQRFEEIYESFYGKGSAYREAGVEIGLFKINAIGEMVKPSIPEQAPKQKSRFRASGRFTGGTTGKPWIRPFTRDRTWAPVMSCPDRQSWSILKQPL